MASLFANSLILDPGVINPGVAAAGTLDGFLWESFRKGPPEWAPLHNGLIERISDGVHERMSGSTYIKGHIAHIAARDIGRLSESLLQRRIAERKAEAGPSS